MQLEYYKVDEGYKKPVKFECPHNDGVQCSDKNCVSCGWHPNVAKYRMERILKNGRCKNG